MYRIQKIRTIYNNSAINPDLETEEMNGKFSFNAETNVDKLINKNDETNILLEINVAFETSILDQNEEEYINCKCIYELILEPNSEMLNSIDTQSEYLKNESYRITEPYYRNVLESLLAQTTIPNNVLPYQFWVKDED
ncbi:hypothetical protein I6G41_01055 [Staphylococcus equorum]|uniref:hypothetical protein n=1 Tax=Staphylococcus equorum TaxID=246432 RepID=UPI0018D5DCB3|nr:hypothetical protein [Staphylococcus equorum]QPS99702.1 hypothetical protein I6G41_01055 [Staphylococcus equorum]